MLTSVTEQADSLERNANDAIIQSRKLDNISVIETRRGRSHRVYKRQRNIINVNRAPLMDF